MILLKANLHAKICWPILLAMINWEVNRCIKRQALHIYV